MFYGVGKRIFLGFAAMILVFSLSVMYLRYTVNLAQNTLTSLFDEHDHSVNHLIGFRVMIKNAKLALFKGIYLPKDETSQAEIKALNIAFDTLEIHLLAVINKWDNKEQANLTKANLALFRNNLKIQRHVFELLPNFESHNDAFAKFEAEDLFETEILPVLDKINKDINVTLTWKNNEKEEARKSLNLAFDIVLNTLFIIGLIMIVLGAFTSIFTSNKIVSSLARLKGFISKLSKGELVSMPQINANDEIDEINNTLILLVSSMKYNARFAESIGEGQFDLNYEPLSDKDELGYSLKQMSQQLNELVTSLQLTQKQAIVAKDKAEYALSAKSQFLSVMSHEIRTPLNAIMGMANILSDENLNDEQKDFLQTILFSSKTLLHIINEVLDVSKLESGNVKIETTNFDLKNLSIKIHKLFTVAVKEKGLNFELESNLTDNITYIGDVFRINQVLNNLISNAIKFTENGSISLIINVVESNNYFDIVKFEVKDSGIGIASNKLESIFESFTQASENTTRLYGGTGLGLTITKKLVELMGGNVYVASELGKGSIFCFQLKLPKNVIGIEVENTENESANNVSGKHILLVEDNSINAKVMSAFLKKWDMTFEIAENGEIAVSKMNDGVYDLILMDLQMPVMDGYEATTIIRETHPFLPILALSAEALFDVKAKLDECGFNEFVAKPFTPKNLLDKISYYTSDEYKGLELIEKVNKIVSFIKFKELAGEDTLILHQIYRQLVDDLSLMLGYLNEDEDFLIQNKAKIRLLKHKLKPSMKMMNLDDFYTDLDLFIQGIIDEKMVDINLKLRLISTLNTIITEIKDDIKNI
jgi:signal transduction histidine kinase/FixJ family two-component response regulator